MNHSDFASLPHPELSRLHREIERDQLHLQRHAPGAYEADRRDCQRTTANQPKGG